MEITTKNNQAQNCLHLAAASNQKEVINFLSSIDTEHLLRKAQDINGNTPLALHIAEADSVLMPMLNLLGSVFSAEDIVQGNHAGETQLHLAVRRDQPNGIAYSMERGVLHETTLHGSTALHYAVQHGLDSSNFEMLLERGADPCRVRFDGKTPLHLACESYGTAFQSLISYHKAPHFVNIDDKVGNCPIHLLSTPLLNHGKIKMLEKLLQCDAVDINARNDARQTALYHLVVTIIEDDMML